MLHDCDCPLSVIGEHLPQCDKQLRSDEDYDRISAQTGLKVSDCKWIDSYFYTEQGVRP